ncbi:MAG: class I mannose-6-phosphate isomerase [Bacteroidales bacterium]|nr:class I mannose-6-phosphate isomerase [Bacteroidales bacterium]
MSNLYPLKFEPIYKEYIWGGAKLKNNLNKKIPSSISLCAESWEISSIQENLSVVSNGFLAGNNLQEVIEVYMGDIVGDKVYNKFGNEFPILIKLIDATDTLSIQVHPNDEVAMRRHHAFGKTEMWYVLESEPNSQIITGFNRNVTKKEYQEHLINHTLKDILNVEQASKDDIFFLPSGRIHAIGKGILLAEIQQASDITYRIFDWDRVDKNGKPRELHTDLALDVIDFNKYDSYKFTKPLEKNESTELINSVFFDVNRLIFNKPIEKDYHLLDSFVIYLCLDGELDIVYGEEAGEHLVKGETVLIPADLKIVSLNPLRSATILEVFLK